MIGLSSKRLERIISDIESISFDFSSIDDPMEKVNQLRKTEQNVCSLATKLDTETKRLDGYNTSWLTMQASITDKEYRDSDIEIYDDTASKLHPLIDKAYSVYGDLEMRKGELRLSIEQILAPLQAPSSLTPTVPSSQPSAASMMYRLPLIELPKWEGDPLTYSSWKEKITTAVLNRDDLTDDVKVQIVVDRLASKPSSWVNGLKLVGTNLPQFIELLDEHGGDKASNVKALHQQLSRIHCANESVSAARTFYDELECCLRQLSAHGEEFDNSFVYESLMAKLPEWLLHQVLSDNKTTAKVSDLRTKIHALIQKQEEIDRYTSMYEQKPTQPEPSNSKQPRCCILCDQLGHGPTNCSKYKTAGEKYDQLMRKKLCNKCAKPGHSAKQCPSPMTCYHCTKQHPSYTCRDLGNSSPIAAIAENYSSDDE